MELGDGVMFGWVVGGWEGKVEVYILAYGVVGSIGWSRDNAASLSL